MIESQARWRRTGTAPHRFGAYQVAAWRAPGTTRFDSRPANDVAGEEFGSDEGPVSTDAVVQTDHSPRAVTRRPIPGWAFFVLGAATAGLVGGAIGMVLAL